jgi:hypothetical protein
MSRRTYTSEAERLAAEREALRDANRTGHYQAPVSAQEAEAYARRHHPANFGVRRPSAPAPEAPAVSAEQVAQVVREAMGCMDPQVAAGKVARELQALGADSTTVNRAMRRVGEAVTRSDVGDLAASAQAFGERQAAERLARLRRGGGPFQGGTVPR